MAVRMSALRAGRPLPAGRFLIFIPVRSWVDPRAIVRLERLRQLKKKIQLIETRTRDLPACNIVPEPPTLPRAPLCRVDGLIRLNFVYYNCRALFCSSVRLLWILVSGRCQNYLQLICVERLVDIIWFIDLCLQLSTMGLQISTDFYTIYSYMFAVLTCKINK
jgi:hypothetical protein